MDNLRIYEKARVVPDKAKKQISAGRLKGMTDINPMWRIKMLTELFGPCGEGWWYEIVDMNIVPCEGTNETAAFVTIKLLYRLESGEYSKPIYGTGGSMFVASEQRGLHASDECYKMALTDAISVASKALGIGADVYWDKDSTKYTSPYEPKNTAKNDALKVENKSQGKQENKPAANNAEKPENPSREMRDKVNEACKELAALRNCSPNAVAMKAMNELNITGRNDSELEHIVNWIALAIETEKAG